MSNTGFKKDSYLVLGLGRSGLATARFLSDQGSSVRVWDDHEAVRAEAVTAGFSLTDPAAVNALDTVSQVILSPGIPLTHPKPHPLVESARQSGISVTGDIDLLYRRSPYATFVGITGTNGKSTTAALIGHILTRAGWPHALGGNIGVPVLDLPEAPLYVLELSSYQLELMQHARMDIAVLLNITPDHLDRHGSMEGYIRAKCRIFRARNDNSRAFIGSDVPKDAAFVDVLPDTVGHIERTSEPARSLIRQGKAPALVGDHGIENAASAIAVLDRLGMPREEILAGIADFPGLAHRQERVATLDNIAFINDSKATNTDATSRALAAYSGIFWIAGGAGKDGGYDLLTPFIDHISHAFLIGSAASDIDQWLAGRVPVTRSGTLERAVTDAHRHARGHTQPGPVILSPACASFDQFPDFEKRGDAFCAAVLALPAASRQIHLSREVA